MKKLIPSKQNLERLELQYPERFYIALNLSREYSLSFDESWRIAAYGKRKVDQLKKFNALTSFECAGRMSMALWGYRLVAKEFDPPAPT